MSSPPPAMKLRERPEDFLVTELDRYELAPDGRFALYRLEKWDIGTLEALAAVARKLGVARRAIGFGGLKDRHARTVQTISIADGPAQGFEASSFRLEPIGRAASPIARESFLANRFEVVVRDLGASPDLEPVRAHGVPNYFDDQRFGSLRGGSGEWIGGALARGHYERALRLAIASPDPADRRRERELEARMAELWGDWERLARELPPSIQKTVAGFLARRPGAFGFAFELLDRDLRVLYLEAWQSWLWNRMLAALVRRLPGHFELPYAAGRLAFWTALEPAAEERLARLAIPYAMPTARFEGELAEAAAAVLAEEGVELRQLRLKKCRNTFFARGERPARVVPEGLRAATADDELHPGRRKATVAFELPRGAYATVVIKRLFRRPLAAPEPTADRPG